MAEDTKGWELVAENLSFPEGPAWDFKGALYFSNCKGGYITKVDSTGAKVFLRADDDPFTFEKTNGMTFGKDGALYACDFGRGAILRIEIGGASTVYAGGFADKRFSTTNDLAFDPQGNLWFSDPKSHGKEMEKGDGRLFRRRADTGEVELMRTALHFPNGLCFTADGKTLYLAESALSRVLKFAVHEDGSLSEPKVFAELPHSDPDGMALDVEGNLYVAHFGGGCVRVYAPDGTEREVIEVPGQNVSNVEFAGDDLRTLYVTECKENKVWRRQMDVPGLKLHWSP